MNLMRRRPKDLWDPFDFVRDLQDEMSRFLTVVPTRKNGDLTWRQVFEPEIDVKEEADHFLVKADLPGIRKEDIDVSINGNLLTLKGERKEESQSKGKDYFYTERQYGAFSRTIELGTELDAEKVKATYKDGVLELLLPKSETAKSKQIKIEVK